MTYKEYKNDSYNLYTIKTNKFKTCHMEIVFYDEFNKDEVTATNMISDMLSFSSLKYPRKKDVFEKLEDLYNANFYGVASRTGNLRMINFVYNFIDPKYGDKSYFKEVIKFPFEMIFNPNIVNDEFDLRSFKIVRNRNIADINSVKESPTRYAIKQALKFMDNNHPASCDLVGNLSDMDNITCSSLVDTYNKLINNYKCEIYLVGNLDMDKVNIMINEYFRNNIIHNKDINLYIDEIHTNKVKDKTDIDSFKQATLVCLFSMVGLSDLEKNIIVHTFNHLFGQGSLNAKLAMNLREKNSLCYNVSSLYQKYDNLMIVYAGIDPNNKDKCVKLIKKSLKEMQNGDFSDDDVSNAIKSLVNGYKMSLDNMNSLVTNYLFHNLAGAPLLDERIKLVNNVTKKDIINIANKIKLNTIYMIRGEK